MRICAGNTHIAGSDNMRLNKMCLWYSRGLITQATDDRAEQSSERRVAFLRPIIGYDIENLTDPTRRAKYHGTIETDRYGRQIPKQAHGTINLDGYTSSTRRIMCAVTELYDRIVDKDLLVRRMYVVANHILPEADAPKKNDSSVQLDLFTDYAAEAEKQKIEDAALERERKIQAATLAIKKKYGKNAILKGMNLEEGATAKDRNAQIGGHKA